jgi:hypothetical protein
MIVRAVLCPSPPLLASGVTGQADVLPELRDACRAAIAWLLAAAPDAVTVVGPAAVTADWPPERVPDLSPHAPALHRLARLDRLAAAAATPASVDPFGPVPPPGPAPSPAPAPAPAPAPSPEPGPSPAPVPALPLALAIGAQLLDAAGYAGPRILQSIAESASPDACRDLGRDLAADAPLTALLVMGDGSARRSAAAPGYLDERAEPFDTVVEQAFRDGDLSALAALDQNLARDLLAAGRPAWQVLAGALTPEPAAPARPRTQILYSDAPLGVAYLVATLDPTP